MTNKNKIKKNDCQEHSNKSSDICDTCPSCPSCSLGSTCTSNTLEAQSISHAYMHAHMHAHMSHESSLWKELECHLPWATFSVACGFVLLSILSFFSANLSQTQTEQSYFVLFHAFHYLHIVYAVVGTMVTFSRFSKHLLAGLILSVISPLVFCTLSDIALPALAGNVLGVSMNIHICLMSELHNIIPLLSVGLFTGFVLRSHKESMLSFFSLGSHFIHIMISSLAAMCYMVAYGFSEWYNMMGLLFLFLIVAIIIPCTMSDIVVPWYFAQKSTYTKHKN